jgi:hypothetical protein
MMRLSGKTTIVAEIFEERMWLKAFAYPIKV